MKIYLAATFSEKDWLNTEIVPILQGLGHEITSRWLLIPTAEFKKDGPKQNALNDLEDVDKADIVVLFCEGVSPGKNIEYGYALAKKKPVILYKPDYTKSIFYHLSYEGAFSIDWLVGALHTMQREGRV